MSNLTFLFAAYSVTWLVLFGYLAVLWRKQRRLERDMRRLREQLQDISARPSHDRPDR